MGQYYCSILKIIGCVCVHFNLIHSYNDFYEKMFILRIKNKSGNPDLFLTVNNYKLYLS